MSTAEGRRSWRTWQMVTVGVAALLLGVGIGGATKPKETTVSAASPTTTAAPASTRPETTAIATTVPTTATTRAPATTTTVKTGYGIGETAPTGDLEVTVYGYKDPQASTNQFVRPKSGNHFVAVDVQVANKGTQQRSFSSIFGFHLVDGANRQYDETIASGITPGPPDGEIPAGGAVRGLAVFEVPDGSTGLRLRVQGSLTAAGAFFALS